MGSRSARLERCVPDTRSAASGRWPGQALATGSILAILLVLLGPAAALAAGPPFPSPVAGQRVYDTAHIFHEATVASAEGTIRGIEERTGAQVAVYTQPVDYGVTADEARSQARALMDQWGIGRKGFDDGLVILYDLDPSGCHGQVQLYAGSGYRSTFLSDTERQQIFDGQMLPYLQGCQFDQSLLAALASIDANATPAHAATLERARQLDAVLGLVVGPIAFLLLIGWVLLSWVRHGRDPVYLDDPSIHLPAPPPDLTPASGALVYDGRSNRHTLTTALLDLGSRGELRFEQEPGGLLAKPKLSISLTPQRAQDPADHEVASARRQSTSAAEAYALERLRARAGAGGVLDPASLLEFSKDVAGFDDRLEAHVVAKGWFGEKPKASALRWYLRGGLELALGVVMIVIGVNVPMAGLVVVGVAVGAASVVTLVLAYSMPARTLPGAMVRAMLAAYRRTLEKTMAGARSMGEVVAQAGLPWLDSPDRAVVWAVALGLHGDVERVLARSVDDAREAGPGAPALYFPAWYVTAGAAGSMASAFSGGSAFSGSAIPDFGGMMAAIGTVGSAPGSSGGGGGFGGGGGGGGGGAGGGF